MRCPHTTGDLFLESVIRVGIRSHRPLLGESSGEDSAAHFASLIVFLEAAEFGLILQATGHTGNSLGRSRATHLAFAIQ